MADSSGSKRRLGDTLRESTAPPAATHLDNSAGEYPTDEWEVTYFSASHQGVLTAHRVMVRLLAGLTSVCPPVRIGQPGCIYAVRRWGFALRPSALEAAGFDPTPSLTGEDDVSFLRRLFQAASFDLPGEFILASPEHPFRLVGPDGKLRGSSVHWRTYLGALAFFASGGQTDADFIRFWAEAESSYRQAVDICLESLNAQYGAPAAGAGTVPGQAANESKDP
jgi:hypothetical protein